MANGLHGAREAKDMPDDMSVTRSGNIFFFKYYFAEPSCWCFRSKSELLDQPEIETVGLGEIDRHFRLSAADTDAAAGALIDDVGRS
jgi:hypothetical protein